MKLHIKRKKYGNETSSLVHKDIHKEDFFSKYGNTIVRLLAIVMFTIVLGVSVIVFFKAFQKNSIPEVLTEDKIIEDVLDLGIYNNLGGLKIDSFEQSEDEKYLNAFLTGIQTTDVCVIQKNIEVQYEIQSGRWVLIDKKESENYKWTFNEYEWSYKNDDENLECFLSFANENPITVTYNIKINIDKANEESYIGHTILTNNGNGYEFTVNRKNKETIKFTIDKNNMSFIFNNKVNNLKKRLILQFH